MSYLLLVCSSSVSLSHTDVRCNNGSLQAQCEMHLLDLQRPWRLWDVLSSKSFTGGLSGVSGCFFPVLGPEFVIVVVVVAVVVVVGFCAVLL